MNPTAVFALLSVFLSTNEVQIGTADLGGRRFNVIGLQVVTNRVISAQTDMDAVRFESWTNLYPGPFVSTNLVPVPPATNVFWRWYDNTFIATNILLTPNCVTR